MQPLDALQSELEQYLSRVFARQVAVSELQQVFGGASRQTWRIGLEAQATSAADRPLPTRLVMRRTQPSALIETEQAVEAGAMRAFAGRGLPIPVPYALETGSDVLEAPFMLVNELPGAAGSPFDMEPYGEHAQSLGRQFWSLLGTIAGDRAAAAAFAEFSPQQPDELAKWRQVTEEDSLGAEPVLAAALRWLADNPPAAPQRLSPVHGDYRSGNFLHRDGQITAILDWEMAHLGDPLEDVAWALSPIWSPHAPARPCALTERDLALQYWSDASGMSIDREALRWWEVFAAVKGMAIWISAGKEFASGSNDQPINLFPAWACADMHLQHLIHRLAPAGTAGAEVVI